MSYKVSGVSLTFRRSDISQEGLCARRIQFNTYFRIWPAQRSTLLNFAVTDT